MNPDLVTILGIWGGVVSTVLGVIRVLEYARDRKPQVRVEFSPKVLMPTLAREELLAITVVNTGKRPVTITALGLQLSDGTSVNVPPQCYSKPMEATLAESEQLFGWMVRQGICLEKIKWAFASSSDKNIYKSKRVKSPKG